jgi:molecular chaperone HscB
MTENPYKLFRLPLRYELDMEALRETLQALQRAVHPDRHAHEAASDRLRAANESARINEAYLSLKDPVRRAEALAACRGIALPSGEVTIRQPELLMEQMLLRERLEACREERGMSDLEVLQDEVAQMLADTKKELALALEASEPDAQQVLAQLSRLKFLRKLEHELSLAEEQLADY